MGDHFYNKEDDTYKKYNMNIGHILGRKRNRLSRCNKRLSSKELIGDQRSKLVQRAAELEKELNSK